MKFSHILLCEFAIYSKCESGQKIAMRSQVHFVRSEAMRIRNFSQFCELALRI